jgi:hypothetical protein
MHRGVVTTELECSTNDAAVFQADNTEIEPSPVLHACVNFFRDSLQFLLTWLVTTTSSHTLSNGQFT